MLVLDHVFCLVPPGGDWAARVEAAGWVLDAGTRHLGQGTRNRRLVWDAGYLELAWVEDRVEARSARLRLDRRADWRDTGASPFGIALRGRPPDDARPDYRLHEDLGFPLWVHRDDVRAPDRPMVVVLDLPGGQRRPSGTPVNPGALTAIRHTGPVAADVPAWSGPRYTWTAGPHRLELGVDRGMPVEVTELLALVTR